jgi:large subunit ribosomal protein L33
MRFYGIAIPICKELDTIERFGRAWKIFRAKTGGDSRNFSHIGAKCLAGPWSPVPGSFLLDRAGESRMAKSKKKAEVVFLVCKETGDYNYILRRKPGTEKLSLKKYCPKLRRHTEHAEKKK